MKKIAALLVMLCVATAVAFAAPAASSSKTSGDSVFGVSYNTPFVPNVYVSEATDYYGIGVSAAFELPIVTIKIPGFPIDIGAGVWANIEYGAWWYGGIYWGIAPVATVHKSMNFGKDLHFDVFVALGLSIYGSSNYSTVYPGFANLNGISWELTKGLWLYAQGGYNYGYGNGGAGVRFTF